MHMEMIHDHKSFGFDVTLNKFSWSAIKQKRDEYIKRLNGIYETNLGKSEVEFVYGHAEFNADKSITVGDQILRGEHVLIATGGRPMIDNKPGAEHGITSDGFFELEDLPKRTVVVGAGYI